MATYAYETEIGEYSDPVKLSINLKLKNGPISAEDYKALNSAFDTIEEIAIKHQELNVPEEETK